MFVKSSDSLELHAYKIKFIKCLVNLKSENSLVFLEVCLQSYNCKWFCKSTYTNFLHRGKILSLKLRNFNTGCRKK